MNDSNIQTAARFLSLTVDHIDTLLSDWYPGLDTTNIFGENLVTRLIPCEKCIRRVIAGHSSSSHRQPTRSEQPGHGQERPSSQNLHIESDEHAMKPSSSFGKSTFYCPITKSRAENDTLTDETKVSAVRCVESPSSDSGSSSGLGTDDSCSGIEHRDDCCSPDETPFRSGKADPCQGSSSDREDLLHRRIGLDHDSSDSELDNSEADHSSASSQTSGVAPSPGHVSNELPSNGTGRGRTITGFEFEECIVSSHKSDFVHCPFDGELALKEIAPDVVS